ncbi:MAG: hydroxyacid dehydrogenase [Idiomarina sp.]|uniref:Putative zinc-type alcohol dehydrogenase-like protein n=1 Tax=Idiomarina aquatica TaxID=1327752 RepID=A0A4R6PKM0_9GAMM|nr:MULTISPECIES: NAD(P)-dependent alcohol dehydrogenase [Idiomarina]MAK71491.1 hydroxyacid dehydrogenase [Idiomarinaceae bacterium]MBL4742326.1 NAD(P)-dependent alcohol dehydrogenase [Idiomarina sp.]MBT41192.1 hydroxyacid dehydrogenase [Idiomarina sp.]PHQ77052.1 MAG: hydroxyacid dehydrogenase [Idiomarina sp.]TDP38183.1 putative zinc-type alcohol dehydrogenase-like protein [Idiomarina aquatica]
MVKAYAAKSETSGLAEHPIERRQLRDDDVAIEIDYCGVCHTDIHYVENDWGGTVYPVVPGHEIIGRVTEVGAKVTAYKPGDTVGVGCLVDSCRDCSACHDGLEQYCLNGMVPTYNGEDLHDGSVTYGGYSEGIVVSDRFVVKVPESLDPAKAAPLLCAGITTYSPLRHYGVKKGDKVGVIGMGGLGHMGVKFAKALGAEVTIFTRSESKVKEAKKQGADHVVISTDEQQMQDVAESFDFMLDTVPVKHDLNPYLNCLKYDGTHIIVGLLESVEPPLEAGALVLKRRVIAGSLIGGLPETQEMLDFCGEHGIHCDVEMLDIENINEAYERMKKGDVKYRFVIDMNSLKKK